MHEMLHQKSVNILWKGIPSFFRDFISSVLGDNICLVLDILFQHLIWAGGFLNFDVLFPLNLNGEEWKLSSVAFCQVQIPWKLRGIELRPSYWKLLQKDEL